MKLEQFHIENLLVKIAELNDRIVALQRYLKRANGRRPDPAEQHIPPQWPDVLPQPRGMKSNGAYPEAARATLPESDRRRLLHVVDRHGRAKAARLMHSSGETLSAAVAGLPLRRETISHLLVGLEIVEGLS